LFKLHAPLRLLALLVILLPVYGSWLNRDFAATNPFHRHIYLNGSRPHRHPLGSHPLLLHNHSSDLDDVVSIPNQDATGAGATSMQLWGGSTVIIPDIRSLPEFVLAPDCLLVNGVSPRPLERPPRT